MEMEELLDYESVSTLGSLDQEFCPECGSSMIEVNRIVDDGEVYVWYACSGPGCDGSWLERFE
ncbi:MAG: zf-TFIIB domain-containing protein [Sedimentisphaerales bacterium]